MKKQKFRLQINVNLIPIDPANQYSNAGFKLEESHEIETKDFLELCKVLGKFHDLAASFAD